MRRQIKARLLHEAVSLKNLSLSNKIIIVLVQNKLVNLESNWGGNAEKVAYFLLAF
jgi:hypothetical protein